MAFDGIVSIVKDEDLTTPATNPAYSLGAKHYKNGNEYVYVYAVSAFSAGHYGVVDANGGTSFSSGYSVTVTNASLAGNLACVAQVAFTAAQYGWMMTKGVSLIQLDSGAVSMDAGALLALGTNGGFVAAGATFSTAPRFGFMLNSGVTAGTGKGRIVGACL